MAIIKIGTCIAATRAEQNVIYAVAIEIPACGNSAADSIVAIDTFDLNSSAPSKSPSEKDAANPPA